MGGEEVEETGSAWDWGNRDWGLGSGWAGLGGGRDSRGWGTLQYLLIVTKAPLFCSECCGHSGGRRGRGQIEAGALTGTQSLCAEQTAGAEAMGAAGKGRLRGRACTSHAY